MRFNNPQYPYLVKRNINILDLLDILQKNKTVPVVVVNNDLSIYGIISKGDLIDYISSHPKINILNAKAEDITNKLPVVGHLEDSLETIKKYLEPDNIKLLPILDHKRRVIKIITKESPSIKINKKTITEDTEPYLIAEIGVNHNGELQEAFFLINAALKQDVMGLNFNIGVKKHILKKI